MTTVDGGPVVAHAQAFADEINRRWGFTHILTYPGHEPDQQHALDNFQTRDVMLQLAQWCTQDDTIDRYGIDYVIFNVDESTVGGEIYNREIARYWRHMEDRGSPTQNHHDHVHVSFNPTAKGPFGPGPTDSPQEAPEVAAVDYRNQLHTFTVNEAGELVHRWKDRDGTSHREVRSSGNVPNARCDVEVGFNGQLHVFTPRPASKLQHDWHDGTNWGAEVLA